MIVCRPVLFHATPSARHEHSIVRLACQQQEIKLRAKYGETSSQISDGFRCPNLPGKLGGQPVNRSPQHNFRSPLAQLAADSSNQLRYGRQVSQDRRGNTQHVGRTLFDGAENRGVRQVGSKKTHGPATGLHGVGDKVRADLM